MKCNEFTILDFFEGDLSQNEKEQLIQHIDECQSCNKILGEYYQIFDTINESIQLGSTARNRSNKDMPLTLFLGSHPETIPSAKYRSRGFYLPRWIAVAAVLAVIFAGVASTTLVMRQMGQERVIASLEDKMQKMSTAIVVNSFEQLSASQRIDVLQTLTFQQNLSNPELDIIMKAINNDESMNVRTSAALILAQHRQNLEIRDFLHQTILDQTNPYLQLTLLEYLSQDQDREFKNTLAQLVSSDHVFPMVKEEALRITEINNN